MDLCDGSNYYKGEIDSKEMPQNLSFSDADYLNHLLRSLDPYNSDEYSLSTDESGENIVFQIHLQLSGMSVKLTSIICYLYSHSSLDYLKSLINQCNSLQSELEETKHKYDDISNTYRSTKKLLDDSIKKKVENERILMIKYMKLLNEKKDRVEKINNKSNEEDQYESLSEESDTNIDPEPIPSIITSSSQELLSLLNTNTTVQKRTRKYIPPPQQNQNQQNQPIQTIKSINANNLRALKEIEESPPKKRSRVRKNINKEKEKQREYDESELLSQLDKKESSNNSSSNNNSNNGSSNLLSLLSDDDDDDSQDKTQIVGMEEEEDNNNSNNKNNSNQGKRLSDLTTQSVDGMSLSSLPTQVIDISQNGPPRDSVSGRSSNSTQDKKKSSEISQIPEDLFSLL